MTRRWSIISPLVLILSIACSTQGKLEFEYRYHNYAESTALLQDLVSQYPTIARLYSLGKTVTGKRELWCMEIGNPATGASEDKPAAYFDGNQHDIEVMGGEATLHLAYYLLTHYGSDPEVTKLIDTRVIYIVQRADPDGAEAFLAGKIDWDPARMPGQADLDEDGQFGEDGPEDINGDESILQMRIADPNGDWTGYDRDARIMIHRTPDSKGPFFRLIDEGIDNDGDGQINEDPPKTRFISNRNFPAFWSSKSGRYRGAGDYPLQERHSRILVDFILSKPQISVVESYHCAGSVFIRPLGALPDSEIPLSDLRDYNAILAKGQQMTGFLPTSLYHEFSMIDPNLPPDEQPGARYGTFVDWAYWHRGMLAVTTELWTMEPFVNEVGWADIPRHQRLHSIPGSYRRPDVQTQVLKWLDMHKDDHTLTGEGFKDWTGFNHPTLGKVELGGFTKFWLFNSPPGPYFRKILEDQAKFCLYRALLTPLVKIERINVRRDTEHTDQWIVQVAAANDGYLDTSMKRARDIGIAKPDRLTLKLPKETTTPDPIKVEFPFMWGTRGSDFRSLYHGSWHIQAKAGTTIIVEIRSEKGGIDKRHITLQ